MYLITGISGLLGLSLAQWLARRGHPFAGLSQHTCVAIEGIPTATIDLRDVSAVRSWIEPLRPSVLFHCAAATNVDWCERHPNQTIEINAKSAEMLSQIANDLGARLVYISTDSVFDGKDGSYNESDQPGPLNVYARSKLEAEALIARTAKDWLIVRTNIYGWNGQSKKSLAEWVVQELTEKRNITGFKDVIFSPLLTTDLSELLYKMVQANLHGLYHAGAAQAVSKLEFAHLLATAGGLDAKLIQPGQLSDRPLSAARPLNTSLSCRKLEQALGEPMPDIEMAVRRFFEEAKNGWADDLKKHIL